MPLNQVGYYEEAFDDPEMQKAIRTNTLPQALENRARSLRAPTREEAISSLKSIVRDILFFLSIEDTVMPREFVVNLKRVILALEASSP